MDSAVGMIFQALLCLVIFIMLASSTWNYFNMPIVEYSRETKACKKVISQYKYTCTDLPERYKTVWVK